MKLHALIEVDITRGNLNPLPIAVSALYSDSGSVSTKTEVTYEDGRKGYLEATLSIIDSTIYQLQEAAE